MTQPLNSHVDVLAVMRDAHAKLGLSEGRELWVAHIAVAELIGAARPLAALAELFDDELRSGNMPKDDGDSIMEWPRVHKDYKLAVGHLRKLRAALANVGAAP